MLVVCRGGSLGLLNGQKGYLSTLYLALFTNDHDPAEEDTVDDYTEASFPGYDRVLLDSWGTVFLNSVNKAEIDEQTRLITATGETAESVFGYLVLDVMGRLVWAERAEGAAVVMSMGMSYPVTPRLTNRSDPG